MSKQVTTQTSKLFIGIDIHKKTWKVHLTTDLTVGNGLMPQEHSKPMAGTLML